MGEYILSDVHFLFKTIHYRIALQPLLLRFKFLFLTTTANPHIITRYTSQWDIQESKKSSTSISYLHMFLPQMTLISWQTFSSAFSKLAVVIHYVRTRISSQ